MAPARAGAPFEALHGIAPAMASGVTETFWPPERLLP